MGARPATPPSRGRNSMGSTTARRNSRCWARIARPRASTAISRRTWRPSLINVDFKEAPISARTATRTCTAGSSPNSEVTHCGDCHNATKWKPSSFDHDKRTTFALEGEHRNVACAGCHKLSNSVDGENRSSFMSRLRKIVPPATGQQSGTEIEAHRRIKKPKIRVRLRHTDWRLYNLLLSARILVFSDYRV